MAKILVVDDVKDSIQLLSFNLEDDNHEVISASSGMECLAQTYQHKPDLILLDMAMPGWNGLETLARLKQDPTLAPTPVIMVSANDADDAIIKAIDIGAHDYIAKPFIYRVLAARIRSALRLKESQESLARLNTSLLRLASIDPLTEAYNRRYFFELARAEFTRAQRHQRPLAILMMDIDHFKQVNDNYGHQAGDEALITFTHYCQKMGRGSDIFARLGGEEFAFCCPDTDLQGASRLAERVRQQIDCLSVRYDKISIHITTSIGISCMHNEDPSLEDIIRRADRQLYKAKTEGRNRCLAEH